MTNDQLRSQAFGISLAVATAIGCVAYEKLVKSCSYFTVACLVCLSYFPFACGAFWLDNDFAKDKLRLVDVKWYALVYLLSGVTGPLWYMLTRKQSVLVGATYEFKYIVILTAFYALFGVNRMSWNIVIGILLAAASVYFVSKS